MPATPPRPVEQLAPLWLLLPSLGFTWDCHPVGSTGLPCPFGSTLISLRSACGTVFQSFTCASSLHPFGCVWLLLLSGFTMMVASVLCYHSSSSDAHCSSHALHSRTSVIARSLQSHGSTGISTDSSISVNRFLGSSGQAFSMAPLSLISPVSLHPGQLAGGYSLDAPSLNSPVDYRKCFGASGIHS